MRCCLRIGDFCISIHAPRKGVRHIAAFISDNVSLFQSTHPARGCDLYSRNYLGRHRGDFNPRTPQGGATCPGKIFAPISLISIHAPRKGVRLDVNSKLVGVKGEISIHAPRKGVRQQNCVKIDTIAQFRELSGNDTSRNLRFCSL